MIGWTVNNGKVHRKSSARKVVHTSTLTGLRRLNLTIPMGSSLRP